MCAKEARITDSKVRDAVYYEEKAKQFNLPQHETDALVGYIMNHTPCGSFLTACLENNLSHAVQEGDLESRRNLVNIAMFLHYAAPWPCWGSEESVSRWLAR